MGSCSEAKTLVELWDVELSEGVTAGDEPAQFISQGQVFSGRRGFGFCCWLSA